MLLAGSPLAADPLPPADKLIQRAAAAQSAQQGWKFTYREDDDQFLIGKKGRRVPSPRKTFEVIMLEGEPYRKLVLIDGKPLSAKSQEQVTQDLERERALRRQHPKEGHTVTKTFVVSVAGIEQLERFFDTRVTTEEVVLGRKCWRLESTPKRGVRPANKEEQLTAATRRVTWIDREEGAEIKRTSIFVHASHDIQPGTEFTEEFSKIGEAWLPATAHLRFDFKIGVMQHAYGESHARYYDYKRFSVDSRIIQQ